MASGIGVNGGPGRCYGLWLDFTKCLGDSILPQECTDHREDYLECLHRKKENTRRKAILDEYERKKKLGEDVPPPPSSKVDSGSE